MRGRATAAYEFPYKKLKQNAPSPDILIEAVTAGFVIVSIVLDRDDNPYTIFESLNAKGQPLSQADLICKYFFMRIHHNEHDEAYRQYWQRLLADADMTEFFRQFLMRDGTMVSAVRVRLIHHGKLQVGDLHVVLVDPVDDPDLRGELLLEVPVDVCSATLPSMSSTPSRVMSRGLLPTGQGRPRPQPLTASVSSRSTTARSHDGAASPHGYVRCSSRPWGIRGLRAG